MNEKVKKSLKLTGKIVLWGLAVVLVLLLALPLWIGPVVKGVANSVVPGIVGTEFHLGEFGLNPYTGCLHVGDLQLANPTNYSKENCVELGALDVNVAMTSIFSRKLRIEEIVVQSLRVSSTTGGGNFMQIAENASGETEEEVKADLEAAEKIEEARARAKAAKEAGEAVETAESEEASEGGLEIDRLVIDGLTVNIGMVPFPIPKLTIEGIGADSESGASLTEVGNTIWDKVAGAMASVGGAVVDGAAAVGGAVADGATAVGGAVADGVGKAAGAVSDGVGKAAGAVSDGVGKAADALKGLFK